MFEVGTGSRRQRDRIELLQMPSIRKFVILKYFFCTLMIRVSPTANGLTHSAVGHLHGHPFRH